MMDDKFWRAQRVIITAGAGGIGLAIAKAMLHAGAQVWISDIDPEALDKAAVANPGLGTSACDVADPQACDRFVKHAADQMSGIDILINNAGIAGHTAPVHEQPLDEWVRCFDINVHGQFYMARAAIPHLKMAKGGSIVCMTSVAGKFAFALRAPYSASKAAVINLARAMSVELGPDQIRVNAIAPGAVAGQRIRDVITSRANARNISYAEMEAHVLRAVSMNTMVAPEEIADYVMFLCAPTGRAITGQVLSICGGIEYAE